MSFSKTRNDLFPKLKSVLTFGTHLSFRPQKSESELLWFKFAFKLSFETKVKIRKENTLYNQDGGNYFSHKHNI